MSTSHFLRLPATIRDQIYAKLLTCLPAESTAKGSAPTSPICNLLFVNRSIHHEVLAVLQSSLCILIKSNDPQFVKDILDGKGFEPLLLISQLTSKDGKVQKKASKTPVAMVLEFYTFKNKLPSESRPMFLMPASSLKSLLGTMWQPSWSLWCMQASFSLEIQDTYSYTHAKAMEKLVQPWIDWFIPSRFLGVRASPSIPETMVIKLRETTLGEYNSGSLLQKLESIIDAANDKAGTKEWDDAAERLVMATKFSDVLWDCYLEHFVKAVEEGSSNDLVHYLWLTTIDMAANQVLTLLHSAKGENIFEEAGTATVNLERVQEARQVGERLIKRFSSRKPYARDKTAQNERVIISIRKNKAKLSYCAHLACKELGLFDAAVGYLQEAIKIEPEIAEELLKAIEGLKAQGADPARITEDTLVRWTA